MNTSLRLRLTLLLVFLPLLPAYPLWGAVIYVDASATGANNGSSWADAFNYLKDAIMWAGSGSEIWVAQGTYRPDMDSANPAGTNDRYATFPLINNIALYGGFPSGGGLWESRDPNTYKTILSGDIGFPDDNSDNSYHVVTGSGTNSTAILDGFTVTAGNASGSSSRGYGAGMYNSSGNPTVINCTFSGNSASDLGGGMYNYYSNSTVTNCTFTGNSASNRGGGMSNDDLSNSNIVNCAFSGNSAQYGGGMENSVSNPTLTNCTFSGNEAYRVGGGMANKYSSPIVNNCTFSGNLAIIDSGGMYNNSGSPTLTNCTFNDNSADNGGGLYNDNGSSPTLTNCTFISNSATDGSGGGMCNWPFNNNPTLTNCTFTGNSAFYEGGGICNTSNCNITVTNCILWGNNAPTGPQIYNDGTGSSAVTFSDVQDGWTGTGNINADPLFVDANDNLRLSPGSPCIDKGNNAGVPPDIADLDGDSDTAEPTPLDLDYRPRFIDGDCNGSVIVDMGAFEFTHAYLGDFDSDCDIDFIDFAIQADFWLTDEFLVDIAPMPAGDGIVDTFDLAVLCDNWLESF